MSWTDERVEQLKKLWSQGLSASQIAAELNHGITRNAVIGKVHRLGLSGRAKTPTSSTPRPRKVTRAPSHPLGHTMARAIGSASGGISASRPAVRGNLALRAVDAPMVDPVADFVVQPYEDVVVPMSERISIMELRESTCRWPYGDPSTEEFRFCGAESPVGTPYCAFHSKIAYQPTTDRRKQQQKA